MLLRLTACRCANLFFFFIARKDCFSVSTIYLFLFYFLYWFFSCFVSIPDPDRQSKMV